MGDALRVATLLGWFAIAVMPSFSYHFNLLYQLYLINKALVHCLKKKKKEHAIPCQTMLLHAMCRECQRSEGILTKVKVNLSITC